MRTFDYSSPINYQRLRRLQYLWRGFLRWFPVIAMGFLSVLWFFYLAHLWGKLPDDLDNLFSLCGYVFGARVTTDLTVRCTAIENALVLAPFALGLPFVFIVRAIRQLETEKTRSLESQDAHTYR